MKISTCLLLSMYTQFRRKHIIHKDRIHINISRCIQMKYVNTYFEWLSVALEAIAESHMLIIKLCHRMTK
jgi:hypothetical protein